MNRRQLFDLGDAVAILGPDADGLCCLCIVQGHGPEAERPPTEVWVFGKQSLRVLGEIALAAQRFHEDGVHTMIQPHLVPDREQEPDPLENVLPRGIDTGTGVT